MLVISAGDDPFAPPNDLAALEQSIAKRNDPRSQFWKVPGAGHVLSMTPDPEVYRAQIESFLTRATEGIERQGAEAPS